jgi:hypothetical protein
MIPGPLDLPAYKGATFGPIVMQAFSDLAHTIPANLTGWLAHAKVRETSTGRVVLDLLPMITDGPNGKITIPAVSDEVTNTAVWPRGNYVWDLLLERPTGEVLGPFLAGIFPITAAISRAA